MTGGGPLSPRWPDGLRWGVCFVVAVGVHATAAAALLHSWQPVDEPVAGGPAIILDLAPVAAAPDAPESEAAPKPQAVAAPPDPVSQPTDKPDPEPDPPVVTASVQPPDEPLPKPIEPPAPPVEATPLPETPPMLAEVVLPPPRPPIRQEKPKHHRRVADLNSAPPRTEHTAAHPVAPAPGASAHDPNAAPRWKTELVSRLQRYKRYPSEAQARGEQGGAQLSFSVDRSGAVHNPRIVRSSGSSLLDRATLDLIARAAPLPPPPPEVTGARISIVVPINYNLR